MFIVASRQSCKFEIVHRRKKKMNETSYPTDTYLSVTQPNTISAIDCVSPAFFKLSFLYNLFFYCDADEATASVISPPMTPMPINDPPMIRPILCASIAGKFWESVLHNKISKFPSQNIPACELGGGAEAQQSSSVKPSPSSSVWIMKKSVIDKSP